MATLTPAELAVIIGNTDKKMKIGDKQDYLLLIREQNKGGCLMIVTDCETNFWRKTMDLKFFQDLRNSMNLNSSELKVFASHFINSLKESGLISKCSQGHERKITISLGIGQGLVLTCNFKLTDCINFDQNPIGFKNMMHSFLLQLWQVKNGQIADEKKKGEQIKKEFIEKERLEKEGSAIKDILQGAVKKGQTAVRKYNLMNPQKKKRKRLGAKLNVGPDSDLGGMI